MFPFQQLFNLAANAMGPQLLVPQAPPFTNRPYRCYPVVVANKSHLENSDKIILPATALDHLARLNVTYPMMFKLTNKSNGHSTHCGVMEFSAEEGVVYAPYWMMQNLLLEPGKIIEITNVSLTPGKFVKFQPHQTKFTELSNPRVVLEKALRQFSCLTKGDTITIQHGEENFCLDVVELKPADAVCIVETDVQVDFEEPLDYKEKEKGKDKGGDKNNNTKSSTTSSSSSLSKDGKMGSASNSPSIGSSLSPSSSSSSSLSAFSLKSEESKEGKLSSPSSSSSSSSSPSNNKSDYFSKLGSGNKINGGGASSLSSSSSSAPLKTNGNSLTKNSLSSPSSSSSSLSSPSSSSSQSSLPPSPSVGKEVIETIGRFDYIYSVDDKGTKKLIKRVAAGEAKKKDIFKAKEGQGYSLR